MGLEKSCEIIQIEKQFPYFQRVCQSGMVSGGDGTQCAAQVSRDIMLEFAAGYGVAKDFELKVQDVIINNGAEMIVVVMGEIMRMPGLPKNPQALQMDIVNGQVEGLS